MQINPNLQIFTDGGSRGNPGQAGIGVVIKAENRGTVGKISSAIGTATNNEAEYQALIYALEYLSQNKNKLNLTSLSNINFFSDSTLLVNQVNGLFKVKNSRMRDFIYRIRELESQIPGKLIYNLIPREKNYEADLLVNKALDKK